MKLLIIIVLIFACSPNPSADRIQSTEPVKGEATNPVFKPNQTLYWYTNQNVGPTLTVVHNSTNLSYMRGQAVNSFLNTVKYDPTDPDNEETDDDEEENWTKTYCIVVSYNNPNAKKQLRARAVPIAITNFQDNTKERIFRIDWPLAGKNADVCKGELPTINSLGAKGPPTSDAAYTPETLCPTCSGSIGSTNVSIYYENLQSNGKPAPLTIDNRVDTAQFDPAVLFVRVDFTNTGIFSGTCSQSFCIDNGYDCCVEGQCVKDKTERVGAIQSPNYSQAMKDVFLNPSSYVNYPQIFNVCAVPSPVPPETEAEDGDREEQLAELRFNIQKQEYLCLEEAKKPVPNYEEACNNKYLCVPLWLISNPGFNGKCDALDDQNGYERYSKIQIKVWKQCGCKADPFPSDPEDPRCPDFTWKPVLVDDVITEIICSGGAIEPETQITFGVPARSSPHRFYRADDGKSVDDITTLQKITPEVLPEGVEFFYLDDVNKTDPENTAFNMNAIMGQFKVNLSQAQPAIMVSVEFDTSYVIDVVTGSLNPCPLCTRDSWEDSFFSWAPSQEGRGLQAVGFTTTRNQVNYNSTRGNYEDTGFGRYCWLPPTMLPFSHKPKIDVKVQRQDRLLTQAALYSNGYQRDWFGFNQGALIGSFDGVTWFAVGTIRKVTSTSTKLFLAINKPYSDLSDNTTFTVTMEKDSINTVPDTDFDSELSQQDSRFNQGASCQKYHVCENDTDCITQVGWEYTCADITRYKSSWPTFTSSADEKPNSQIAQANFTQILQNFNPTGKVKRCVYRGNGAPCKKDYTKNVNDPAMSKLLACAPNFYCASLNETSLNSRVDREPAPNNVYWYGFVTNRLGRPQNYIGGDATFPQAAKENFKNSAIIYSKNGSTDDFGICRPGRLLITTSTPPEQPIVVAHSGKDSKQRTDFISEVGSCDSSAVGNNRAITCPFTDDVSATSTNYGNLGTVKTDEILQNSQNMCGAESQYISNGIRYSTFQIIELQRLSTLSAIDQPSLVRDACFRRAGAACHTNLDCSPNELHAQQAFSFGPTFFGGTTAETEFWREDLICGQGQIPPTAAPINSTATTEPYLLNRNRCCRSVGKEFTMYTQYDRGPGDPDLIPDNAIDNIGLDVLKYPYLNPTAPFRYSRYAITQPQNYTSGHAPEPAMQAPILKAVSGEPVTPKEYQWKTFNDTGRKTCCGGGFVRLFSDGTHDWKKINRLSLSLGGLSCLNYQDTIVDKRPLQVTQKNYNKDYGYICISPGVEGTQLVPGPPPATLPPLLGLQTNSNTGIYGCVQAPLIEPDSNIITLPWDLSLTTTFISTVPDEKPAGIVLQTKGLSARAPYIPTPFLNAVPIAADDPAPTYFINQLAPAQSVYLPLYIGGRRNITKVTTSYYTDNVQVGSEKTATEVTPVKCENITQRPNDDLGQNEWCIQNNAYTQFYDVLHIRGLDQVDGKDWGYGGFTIYFNTINTKSYDYCTDNVKNLSATGGAKPPCLPAFDNDPMKPDDPLNSKTIGMGGGNALYYLTKLARLELVGIPQIFYEPLYCNGNREELVKGIFNINPQTRTEFFAQSYPYNSVTNAQLLYNIYNQDIPEYAVDFANPENRVANQDLLSIPRVFSGHKFACCKNLGTETDSAQSCCSEFAAADADGRQICKLPKGADLHVYFNRFVSGDGVGEFQPGGGLEDTDFIPETGEPNLTKQVSDKIRNLGVAYCQSGVVRFGAAFGYFIAQPNNGYFTHEGEKGRYYSIIDSSLDYEGDPGDTVTGTGTIRYLEGYRWNHHLYCAP